MVAKLINIEIFQKKTVKNLIIGIGAITIVYIFLVILLIVILGNQPIGPKILKYHSHFYISNQKNTEEITLLIPAVINEDGGLVFSENELRTAFHSSQYNSIQDSYTVSYKSSDYGIMISVIIPPDSEMTGNRIINLDLETKDYFDNSVSLSPVLESRSAPFSKKYILPVFAEGIDSNSSSVSMSMNLIFCGYDPEHPYDCKGYSTGPDKNVKKIRDYYQIEISEFGNFNDLRHGNPLVLPIEYSIRFFTNA